MRLEEVVNKNYSKLNESDLYILKYIINNKKQCMDLSINRLAHLCNVSRTTILRFTQKIGFKGYSEFKVFLKWEEENTRDIDDDCLDKFYFDLEDNVKNIKKQNYTQICSLIYEAERVFVFGTGVAQYAIAKEMKRIFLSIHKHLYVVEGTTELEMITPSLTSKDILIIISLSGQADYLPAIVNDLSVRNIEYITITKSQCNEIARKTKHNMYITTSLIEVGNGNVYQSTAFFFLLVEVLFREYMLFTSRKNQLESSEIAKDSV